MKTDQMRIREVFKRKSCLESSKSHKNDTTQLFEQCKKSLSERSISRYFSETATQYNANRDISKCLFLLEKVCASGDEKAACNLMSKLQYDILPHIADMNYVKDMATSLNLSDSIKGEILSVIKNIKIADRILENHSMISNRFNIDQYLSEKSRLPVEFLVYEMCTFIDTYKGIPLYAKMNISLEECMYSMTRTGINFNTSSLVEWVSDYYLNCSTNLPENSIEEYCEVLQESVFVSESDMSSVSFLFESEGDINSNKVLDIINKYKKENKKNVGLVKGTINKIFTLSPSAIIDDTPSILSWITSLAVIGTFATGLVTGTITFLADKFIKMDLRRKDADKLLKFFEKERAKVAKKVDKASDKKQDELEDYLDDIDKAIDKIKDYRDSLYSEKELDRRKEAEYTIESTAYTPLSLQEFKVLKFENLISMSIKANKVIKQSASNIKKKTKASLSKIKNRLIKEAIYENFTEDGIFDTVIAAFDCVDCDDAMLVDDEFDALLDSLNNLSYKSECMFYSENYADCREIHMTLLNKVIFTEGESELVRKTLSDMDIYRIDSILSIEKSMNKIIESVDYISEYLPKNSAYLNGDDMSTLIDLAAFIPKDALPSDIVEESVRRFCDSHKNGEISDTIEKGMVTASMKKYLYNDEYKDISICTEAASLMVNVINEAEEDKKKKLLSKPDIKKPEIKKPVINFNGSRLAIEGMKKKVKDLGSKEKEVSRDMDMNFNNLMKNINTALISDRREAIIKGSVIPSFSKTLKIAMASGAAWVINPAIAIIGLIGGLAMSKRLTMKERSLLLDEIDIELKAVDREVNAAENVGNMKKYRALLTYQKKLQREKQRIKYNLNMAGKALPETDKED